MPVIKAGAFDLDYTDVGTGPAVVLVHCSASGHRQWRHLVDALQSRYRLIAVNLFGYGKTSPWPDDRPLDIRGPGGADRGRGGALAGTGGAGRPFARRRGCLRSRGAHGPARPHAGRIRADPVLSLEDARTGAAPTRKLPRHYPDSSGKRRAATGPARANCSSITGPAPAPGRRCRRSARRTPCRCCRRSRTNGR